MNNRISTYILALLMIPILGGCQQESMTQSSQEGEEGVLSLCVTRANQEVDYTDVTLRVYNDNDRLVARYTGDQIPQTLYLAAGNYKATVQIGNQVELSSQYEDISYYGEEEFSIVGGEVNDLDIDCTIQNTIVTVNFDPTVLERFDVETSCYLSIADSFSFSEATSGLVPTLHFGESGEGYFVLPDNANNIAWGFYAESSTVDSSSATPSRTIELSGLIESPAAASRYRLNFVYSPSQGGYLGLNVIVDQSVDEFNDDFSFSPQPTIQGQGFDISQEGLIFDGEELQFSIKSGCDLNNINLVSPQLVGGELTIMESGATNTIPGVDYIATDSKSGLLTLRKEFFALFGEYGATSIIIAVVDAANSTARETLNITVSGAKPPVLDLWSNTAELSAQVVLEDVSEVKFAFKAKDDKEWQEIKSTKGADGSYAATIVPTWSKSTNSDSLDIYTAIGGVWAGTTYQYRVIIDGVEYAICSIEAEDGQTIPNGDMQSSSIKAFSTSSSSSTDWASGNNSFSSNLCTQTTKGGSQCAYLMSRTAVGVFAAGNLNFGQFAMSGFSGVMSFGQPFSWEARPRALRFRYAAIIGAETHDKKNLLDGYDKARVYFAIVDWESRRKVTASTSGNPSNTWDPATQDSTTEGNIIGYASFYITETINGGDSDGLEDIEVPIFYYDTSTKPSEPITMVLSCAASAYGDYMTGSTSSRLWVDDFGFVY
ncbi:MAG: DUF4493 domain-containing protein [Rikenellaceae bacterium]